MCCIVSWGGHDRGNLDKGRTILKLISWRLIYLELIITTTKCGYNSLIHVLWTSEFTTFPLGLVLGINDFIQNLMKSFGVHGCILL